MGEEILDFGTIEVWMRDYATVDVQDRQQEILSRLTRLKDEEIIAEFSVNTWGKHINIADDDSPSSTATLVFDKAREFEHWSEQNDTSLPGFQRRTQSSLLTNATQEVFVTPIICLAIYEDADLRAVIPNSGRKEHRTVITYINSLVRPYQVEC